jgi:hypothetical protein
MSHPLRCRCGAVRGHVSLSAATSRAVCYCKDCQAFAHFLGRADDVLDEAGGTDIVAAAPSQVRFEQGLDALACMSLSERGLLRWYASCCSTPIGNTPRDPKVHYVGLVHSCLSAQSMDESFGSARVRINTQSARRRVTATPVAMFGAVLKLMRFVLPARIGGRYRDNPFFNAQGEAIRAPRVLDSAERSRLKAGISA